MAIRARAGARSRGGNNHDGPKFLVFTVGRSVNSWDSQNFACAFHDENPMDAIFLLLKLGVKRIVKASLVSLTVMGSSYLWYSGAIPFEEAPPKIDGALLFNMFLIGFCVALPLQNILHGLCRVSTVKPAILLASFVALTTAAVAVKPKASVDRELLLKLGLYSAHSFLVTISAISGEILLCSLEIFQN